MTSIKVPVLVSRYAEELFTARVVDGPEADATGATASETFAAVQKFLKQQALREPHQYWPKIDRYELCQTSVRVRLFYRDGNRQFPASRELKVPVRYVLGRYVDDSVECFLTDYDIVFHCPALRELPQLIDEAVRGAAARIASRDLIAATPPVASELRIVRVRLKERRYQTDNETTDTLGIVADPVVKTQRKRKSTPIKHRDDEVAQLLTAIKDSCVMLVGDAGCGKTTITKLAASRHQADARAAAKMLGSQPPPPLVWESSAENLIAGMQYLGEWEQRLEQVIAQLEAIGGVLFVQSQIDLVRLGGTQPTDSLAAFLMPYVRRGEIRLISETTPEELDAARRLLPGWVECFQIVNVRPLSHQQTRDIAATMLKDSGRNHRFDVDDTAAETATRLFAQFMPYQSPPKGVVQLIGDVIEETRRQSKFAAANSFTATNSFTAANSFTATSGVARSVPKGVVGGDDRANDRPMIHTASIVEQFTKLTGLPEAMLRDSLTLNSDDVRARFEQEVIGQSVAVRAAVNVVLRLKAGLCDPQRPVATMLFCGPTGVGKTQLARSLSNYLFGQAVSNEKALVRLDMSEYASWDAVDRFLIGADGEVAPWIGRLRDRPMSVVLLDEFEKSSPEVHDCLLSALDEGRLTDRFGRTTTLCGSIVVLTSNVGSRSTASVGFSGQDNRALQRAIEQEFRPEFLNRLDEVVVFDPLESAVIEQIVEKELQALEQRETLRARRVQLQWDQAVVKRLAAVGFDPLLGARPLQRAIEREVVAKIARQLLETDDDCEAILINLSKLVSMESDLES